MRSESLEVNEYTYIHPIYICVLGALITSGIGIYEELETPRIYEAESPDEYALVKAAAGAGFQFRSRNGNDATVGVRLPHQDKVQERRASKLKCNKA